MFLKCPIVRYVSYVPKSLNYQFPTEGVIHVSALEELISTIETSSIDDVKDKLKVLFENHRLGQILPYLEIDELGDYLRHLVICNHDALDWAYIDYCIAVLDKKFPTRWNIPKLELDQAFRSLFSSFVLLQPTETERFLFRDLMNMISETEKYPRALLAKLVDPAITIKYFSFASLVSLYQRFIRKIYIEERENFHLRRKFHLLNEFFELQFEKVYQKFEEQKMISAGISIIHSYILVDLGVEPFEAVINRFEKNLKSMLSLPKHEQDLLGLLLGASYAKLLNLRNFQNMPMEEFMAILLKTKKLLVPTENVSGLVDVFKEAILTYRIHPMLIFIISEGLSMILYQLALLNRKVDDHLEDLRTLFKQVLDFRNEVATIVEQALEEREWMKASYSFDFNQFKELKTWDTLYYLMYWPADEKTQQKFDELVHYLEQSNPKFIKYINIYRMVFNGHYKTNIIERLAEKQKHEHEGLFYEETEEGLLKVLTYLIHLKLPDIPPLKILDKNELMVMVIRDWLCAFEELKLGYHDLFELLSPILLEIQAQRIEYEYLEGRPTLALIHSINFFLFDLWKKKTQISNLSFMSNGRDGDQDKTYLEMFSKVLSTFQTRENTKSIVQRLTNDLINIIRSTLFDKANNVQSFRSLIELENNLLSQSSKSGDENEINLTKVNYLLGNLVINLGNFFSKLEKNLEGSTNWDNLVKDLLTIRELFEPLNADDCEICQFDLFIFPLKHEFALAEALHIFPMIVEVPQIFIAD
ncbi:MAG: hypothetical protein D6732_15240 [Methanobacteriota archaeon]|nr:MAG: hypothetical protein D6732_15240 [Euryarchaeota archaeon]